ncbi:MAG: hypothetical protein M3362_26575 [Acidobacteriota bacterium]|nr:hypothetical protein [Acidobacteriota bacterium]
MSILGDFLDQNKPSKAKTLTLRRTPPTLEQFRDSHPVSALMALERNALAYETYLREQARRSRLHTFRPLRSGHAVMPGRKVA